MKRFNWGLLIPVILAIAFWVWIISLFGCNSPVELGAEVVFDGPIYAYCQNNSAYFCVQVKNIGQKTAYNVIATLSVRKDGILLGLYELDFDLIPPGECEKREKHIPGIQFEDDVEVKGALEWS